MTREEHMTWCKSRALEYVRTGHLEEAVHSMMSDLRKHPDTAPPNELGWALYSAGLEDARQGRSEAVRRWVEGFN